MQLAGVTLGGESLISIVLRQILEFFVAAGEFNEGVFLQKSAPYQPLGSHGTYYIFGDWHASVSQCSLLQFSFDAKCAKFNGNRRPKQNEIAEHEDNVR